MPRYLVTAIVETGWKLILNPMMGHTEDYREFGPWPTREYAEAFYREQLAPESYNEEGPDNFGSGMKTYRKAFKKDSDLEWLNPLTEAEMKEPGFYGHGFHEVVVGTQQQSKVELS